MDKYLVYVLGALIACLMVVAIDAVRSIPVL